MCQTGVQGVFPNRRDALSTFSEFLVEEMHDIFVLGSSLKGLVNEPGQEYEKIRTVLCERMGSGVKVRFLFTHPQIAELRAIQESRRPKDIGLEIMPHWRD